MKKFTHYEEYEDYDNYEDYHDVEDEEEDDTNVESDAKDEVVSIFAFISTWFIRIGLVLAVILLIAFLISGKFLTAVLYLCGLAVAFVLGYGFMYCLDHFIFSDNS